MILENVSDMTLRALRVHAACCGVNNVGTKSKTELISELQLIARQHEEKVEIERKELEELRRQCVSQGISDIGTAGELRLRLESQKQGAISSLDNKLYRFAAIASGVLCVAALCVSIPHITMAIAKSCPFIGRLLYFLQS